MIDIHSHIIPGVDDGSASMEATIFMVYEAVQQGATAFFATSHSSAFLENGEEVHRRFDTMKKRLGRLFSNKVYLGCEVLCSKEKMPELTEAIRNKTIPTMNDTACVLIEFWEEADWETVEFCVAELLRQGCTPILAHVERYGALKDRMDRVNRLRQQGCLIQLNVYALEETQPEPERNWARQLVADRKVDFLGTDMHGTGIRMPSIAQGLGWLEAHCAPDYQDALLYENAEKILIKGGSSLIERR